MGVGTAFYERGEIALSGGQKVCVADPLAAMARREGTPIHFLSFRGGLYDNLSRLRVSHPEQVHVQHRKSISKTLH